MAPAPSTASTSASTLNSSLDWHEAAKHEDAASTGKVAQAKLASSEVEDDVRSLGSCGSTAVPSERTGHGSAARPGASFAADYEVQEQVLGTGASGSVRQAICRRTGRQVALKSFNVRDLQAKPLLNLEREVDVHTAIQHPLIVSLDGVYEVEDNVHLILEQLSGGELFDRLIENGRFSETQAAKVLAQLLRSLAYLHANGITHRDIKPENVLYNTKEGDDVKLIDFGFATRFDRNKKLTQRCGTLQYVAPEVLTGKGYDEKADVWSLGSVAYTLLTMKAMYGGSDADVQRKNRVGAVDFSRVFKTVSANGQDFIKKLLTVDVVTRPSAEEALCHPWLKEHALEQVAAGVAEAQARQSSCQASVPPAAAARRVVPRLCAKIDAAISRDRSMAGFRNVPSAAAGAVGSASTSKQAQNAGSATSCFAAAAALLNPLRKRNACRRSEGAATAATSGPLAAAFS